MLSLSDLRVVLFEHGDINDLVVAGELGHRQVVVIRPQDSLADALEGLSGQRFEHLVVVSETDEREVLGLLSHQGVMEAYRNALAQSGLFERGDRSTRA